jgi:hypothetical protein
LCIPDPINLALRPRRNDGPVVVAEHLQPPPPLQRVPLRVVLRGHGHGAQPLRCVAVRPVRGQACLVSGEYMPCYIVQVGEKTHIAEPRGDGSSFAMAEQDLDEPEFEVGGIQLVELGLGIRRAELD